MPQTQCLWDKLGPCCASHLFRFGVNRFVVLEIRCIFLLIIYEFIGLYRFSLNLLLGASFLILAHFVILELLRPNQLIRPTMPIIYMSKSSTIPLCHGFDNAFRVQGSLKRHGVMYVYDSCVASNVPPVGTLNSKIHEFTVHRSTILLLRIESDPPSPSINK